MLAVHNIRVLLLFKVSVEIQVGFSVEQAAVPPSRKASAAAAAAAVAGARGPRAAARRARAARARSTSAPTASCSRTTRATWPPSSTNTSRAPSPSTSPKVARTLPSTCTEIPTRYFNLDASRETKIVRSSSNHELLEFVPVCHTHCHQSASYTPGP